MGSRATQNAFGHVLDEPHQRVLVGRWCRLLPAAAPQWSGSGYNNPRGHVLHPSFDTSIRVSIQGVLVDVDDGSPCRLTGPSQDCDSAGAERVYD